MRLNVKAFAVTSGLVWGFGLFFLTWWVIIFEGSSGEVTPIGIVYRGYNISPAGSIIGLVWGLVDGGVAGLIFSWLYNMFVDRCASAKKEGEQP